MPSTGINMESRFEQPARSAPVAVRRRLPGRARPRADVLREYQELNARRRARIPAPLWPFWAPEPEKFYRWRIQLDCGCVTEVLTHGDKDLPATKQWLDPVHGQRLPEGQLFCPHDDSPPQPYRDIANWGDRREISFPADPVEPPDELCDPQLWAKIRHDKPHTAAFWTVILSCGHATEVVAELDWKPADGPHRVNEKKLQEMTAVFEELWATDPDAQSEREREHTKRMLREGWPQPSTEHLCYTCTCVRYINAYQPIGWLIPRKPEPKTPAPPSRASLERRLRQAETDANRLRDQLAQLDNQEIHNH